VFWIVGILLVAGIAAVVTVLVLRSGEKATLAWSADAETGDLSQWNAHQDRSLAVQQDTGNGTCTVSTDAAHSGRYSYECVAPREGDATRLFRYPEPRSGETLVYTAWFYIPRPVSIRPDGNWNIYQFKSKDLIEDRSDPFLSFNLRSVAGGGFELYVYKKPERYSIKPRTKVSIGTREWFGIRTRLKQSGFQSGVMTVWLLKDGRPPIEIMHVTELRTRYPDGTGVQEWSVNNYGHGLDPHPVVLYVDDCTIERAVPAVEGRGASHGLPPTGRLGNGAY
jgi:hypothetical protein